jgi:signal transduction histidine kinase
VAAVFTGLPLVFRRRFPLSAFWIVVVAALLMRRDAVHAERAATIALGAGLVAAYSAAMYSPHRKSMVASLVAGAGLIGLFHKETLPHVTATYIPFAVLLGVGLTANVLYNSRQSIHALEAEQETTTRLAIERERARIASELHDVVTHNVSVMVIQAGAARKVLDTAPEQARQALLAVEAGGRAAMAELRHTMGLLTGSEPASSEDLSPQPGLDQVPVLADRMRDAGVTVEVHVEGTPVRLPAGTDLAAYRVVQEALTNAVKHAAGATVVVTVDHRAPGAVGIDVADDGGTPNGAAAAGNGRGLIGLRERLSVYGATLEAGPRPTGGYRVRAEIPVDQA